MDTNRGQVWRACAGAWAAIPSNLVAPGDRVGEPAIQLAVKQACNSLGSAPGNQNLPETPTQTAISAAFAGLDKDGKQLVGYDDF